ncbi:hypothetical protein K8R20_00630 [bacterium]|nr:hypothetical protein [bacterium]
MSVFRDGVRVKFGGGGELESPKFLLEERFTSKIADVVEWDREVSKGEEENQPTRVSVAKTCMANEVDELTKRAEELSDHYIGSIDDMQKLSEMIGVIEVELAMCVGINLWTLVEGIVRYQCDKYYESAGKKGVTNYLVSLMGTRSKWEELLVEIGDSYDDDNLPS